jgi:thiol:disulfide interchange protein
VRRIAIACVLLTALFASATACKPQSPPAQPAEAAPAVAEPAAAPAPAAPSAPSTAPSASPLPAADAAFDPQRDPVADLALASAEAKRSGRRIMVDVGGEWCIWCHRMDAFIVGDPGLRALRDRGYVWMKVNYSEENENKAFLAGYPEVKGYPHLFVLDADGKLLHSQFTGELEAGKSYDRAKFEAFLRKWSPSGG